MKMIKFKNSIKVNWQKVQPAVKTRKCPVMANIRFSASAGIGAN